MKMDIFKERKISIGIDLGTTNSVISWSTINNKNEIVTEVLKMDMQDITGTVKTELLPSNILVDESGKTIIGKKAKAMISRQPDRVIQNPKNYMGTNYSFKIGSQEITPVEASAKILTFLGKVVEKYFGKYPTDVVITVPASFDTDKRKATLEAAKLAGFNITNPDGSLKNILLNEPIAALHDYVNLQNKNEIPATIDFRTPKNIVVFDLGGGTLDVSIHSLVYNNKGDIDITDLGVSRYTQVGGCNFDSKIGEYLLEKFIQKNKIKNIGVYDKNYLLEIFREYAEEIKLDLNEQIESEKIFGMGDTNLEEISSEIYKTGVFQGYNFIYKMSSKEYKEIVQELLGNHLNIEDVENIDNITETENIIYPILDSLKKSQEKAGNLIKIDGVILNGGMTKFHIIQERLENFFKVKLHSVLDQDKSVARGASVYNYKINSGEVFTKIQNDTIGLERNGNYVHHLIEAGTVLPTRKVISDFVIPENGIKYIDLPFYLGRRKDTQCPNRKIAQRRVYFSKGLNQGENVTLEISVDEMGIMEILGFAGKSKQKFSVEITADGSMEKIEENTLIRTEEEKKIGPNKYVPTGEFINIKEYLKNYLVLCEKYGKLRNEGQKSEIIRKIKSLEKIFINGTNGKHFLEKLLEDYPTFKNLAKERVTYLIGEYGKNYPEYRNEIQNILEKNLDVTELILLRNNLNKALSGYIRFSIEGLRKIEANISNENFLLDLGRNPLLKAVEPSIMMTIGSICTSINSLEMLKDNLRMSKKDWSYWAIGKFGSRERKFIISIELLESLAKEIADSLNSLKTKEILRNAIYALAEICDTRGINNKISLETKNYILKRLDEITEKSSFINKILEVANVVIDGKKLTTEQDRILLDLRTKL